jgi:hypothetical protein
MRYLKVVSFVFLVLAWIVSPATVKADPPCDQVAVGCSGTAGGAEGECNASDCHAECARNAEVPGCESILYPSSNGYGDCGSAVEVPGTGAYCAFGGCRCVFDEPINQ